MSILKIQEELKAPKNQRNNFGNYNYRSAEDIIEAVKPIAHKYNYYLNISDEVVEIGGRIYVKSTARLIPADEKGIQSSAIGYAREEETKKGMDGAQITGAASSYARKYALNGLLAIDDTKDADATNTHDKAEVTTGQAVKFYTNGKESGVQNAEVPTQEKPWLAKTHPDFEKIKEAIKSGQRTMTQLRDKYKVSKAVEAELIK
jgi:hypothetical protein